MKMTEEKKVKSYFFDHFSIFNFDLRNENDFKKKLKVTFLIIFRSSILTFATKMILKKS